jgi:hypothetical protein
MPAPAYEVDNFTDRDSLTQDALPILDQKINHILSRAVEQANRESPDSCMRMVLRQEIVRWVGPDPVSILEFWTSVTGDVQRSKVGFKESIYRDASLSESPAMRLAGIAQSFKLAGHIIGTDKMGHFFMQGLDYYKRVHVEGADLDHVLKYEHGEDGIWGLSTSGVKSYGDMSANYAGFRFWSELDHGETPYVRCEGGKKWVKVRNFTFADYVTDAWDEAINCSEMLPTLAVKARKNIAALGLHCPIDLDRCLALGMLEKAEFYVNPECVHQYPQASQRWRAASP